MTELLTPRAYLVSLGLAKEGRGKFSFEAHAALTEAKAQGMEFAIPKPAAVKKEKAVKPVVLAAPLPSTPRVQVVVRNPGDLARVIRDRPVLRAQETRYALTPEGYTVGYSSCHAPNCLQPLSRCTCAVASAPKGVTVVAGYPAR